MAVGAILKGLVPLIPFDPSWPIDFLPVDVVADAIATAVRHCLIGGEFWITAGVNALSLEEAVAEIVSFGREIGLVVDLPRFVPPEAFDRLIGPVFLAVLPPTIRETVLKLLEFFAVYLSRESAFPSSLKEPGPLSSIPLPDPRESLRASLRYWAEKTDLSRARLAVAVG
jgi:hypothetical protein